MHLLQVHVTSRLGQCEEDSSSTSTDDKTKFLPESQSTFDFIAAGSKKQNLVI